MVYTACMDADKIISVPDPQLRQRARRVGAITQETRDIVETMKTAAVEWEKSRENEVGVALAAPQIGVLERIVIVRSHPEDKDNHEFEVFINPEITKYEGERETEPEGCLSVPDMYGVVARYGTIRVSAMDLDGRTFRMKAHGFLARVLQHEIDHLHGKLFVDTVEDDAFYKIMDNGKLTPLPQHEIDSARVLWHC